MKIKKYEKFFINNQKRYCYTFDVIDNDCPDIKVGDDIEIDGIVYEVEILEWFEKAFHLRGDNVGVFIKEKDE
jgi:hypothetical protein